MSQPILSLQGISKTFPGVQALQKVDFNVFSGEVHCLVGENGSGKSTLIKIISGVEKPDEGKIFINGNSYQFLTVAQAMQEGIQVIYQDLALFPDLTAAENVMFGWFVEKGKQFIDKRKALQLASQELEYLGVQVELSERVSNLSMGKRQALAIARALILNARLLIFDEPTTALTQNEIDTLLNIIMDLKKRGIATIFVSHKLDEVFRVADVVTVLRDGVKVGDFSVSELTERKLSFYMTGKEVAYETFRLPESKREKVLELQGLTRRPHFENISFYVEEGEIVGIIGPLGSGRTELTLSLFGLNKLQEGKIIFRGEPLYVKGPVHAREMGIALLPEDRRVQGLFLKMDIIDNVTSTILEKLKRLFFVDHVRARKEAERTFKELRIRASSLETVVETLSGGNQQKVVLGKCLNTDPKLLILDSPTIGIDVGSKAEIYGIIQELARRGIAILLISDEIAEIFHNCNRIIVMREGKIVRILRAEETSEEELRDIVEGRA